MACGMQGPSVCAHAEPAQQPHAHTGSGRDSGMRWPVRAPAGPCGLAVRTPPSLRVPAAATSCGQYDSCMHVPQFSISSECCPRVSRASHVRSSASSQEETCLLCCLPVFDETSFMLLLCVEQHVQNSRRHGTEPRIHLLDLPDPLLVEVHRCYYLA